MAEATTTLKVTCSACGTEHVIKILPSKGPNQRWACPNCKQQHEVVAGA